MATSFKKKGGASRPQHPRGSRPSLHNSQLLVSSGVPSMDVLLGGGLAVGTVLLIEEDVLASYSRVLLKMFLAEGVTCGHALLLASASEDPADIIKDLPSPVGEEGITQPGTVPDSRLSAPGQPEVDQMQIAWRYQNLPKVQSSFSNGFGHFFDLTQQMDAGRIAAVDVVTFDASQQLEARSCRDLYTSLKNQIQTKIDTGNFSVDSQQPVQQRNVLRIALHSLGSPLWLDGESTDSTHHLSPSSSSLALSLSQFLHTLRALLRKAYAVALVTVPTHLMQDRVYVSRLERLCDATVRLESFAGSDKAQSPLYQDYHGLFHLVKLPCLNTLCPHLPETLDLAFKLKRKKFSIEKLHLPPELSETANRAQEDSDMPSKVSRVQGSSMGEQRAKVTVAKKKHNIDF